MNKIIERETITVDDRLSKYLTGSYRYDEDEEDDCSGETDFDIIRNQYTVIDDNVIYYDLEKSYEEREIIFQRLSDKKFFSFKFNYSPYLGVDCYDNIATEVFPTQITITKYE